MGFSIIWRAFLEIWKIEGNNADEQEPVALVHCRQLIKAASIKALLFKRPNRKFLYPVCYFFCGKKVTKKAARKGLHPLFGMVLLFRFSATVASALYRYS